MISIIIPVYNQAKKLRKCLDSIKGQTFDDYEIIIVNDGSTDGVEEAVKPYQKTFGGKLSYVSQENAGAPAARNRGARAAKGEYLLFCDADMVLEADALATMLNTLISHPAASYAYSSFRWGRKLFKLWPFDDEKLRQMPYIITSSLIRREHFPTFDERLKKFQDWDLWLTMLKQGHTGVWIDRVLFRVHPGGTMSSWLPAFAYKWLPFLPAVKRYNQAMAVIKYKHHLK